MAESKGGRGEGVVDVRSAVSVVVGRVSRGAEVDVKVADVVGTDNAREKFAERDKYIMCMKSFAWTVMRKAARMGYCFCSSRRTIFFSCEPTNTVISEKCALT